MYRVYMRHTAYINNGDLVDVSAEHIVGAHLGDGRRARLLRLARSKVVWERRGSPAGPRRPCPDVSFTADTLRFFRALKRRNERAWFEAHRDEYEAYVRAPMRHLVEEMDVRLARFAPEIVGDPRHSIFRIHRDIRFSKDKSPYKTHVAAWFYHGAGSRNVGQDGEGGSAGFYVQVSPGASFSGGGIWMPPPSTLKKIREAIADDPRGFARVAGSPVLKRRFGGLDAEDSLKRMPRGFADDHPAARWLKFRSFTVGRLLRDTQATGPRLAALLEADFRAMLPLVRWLNAALGLRPSARRS